MIILAASTAIFCLCAGNAWAGMSGVGNATVTKGLLATHARVSYTGDHENRQLDKRWRSRLMADYGVTDRYAVGLFVQGDRRQDDSMELDAVILENRFEFTQAARHGFYSGMRLRYTHRDGDKTPDNAHLRFILGTTQGRWDFRYNQIVAHDVGPDSRAGLGFDTRFQVSYGYAENHRAGIESFSDFGNIRQTGFDAQNHTIGPVFTGALTDAVFYETGYRVGLSKGAADHTFKFFLQRNFHW